MRLIHRYAGSESMFGVDVADELEWLGVRHRTLYGIRGQVGG